MTYEQMRKIALMVERTYTTPGVLERWERHDIEGYSHWLARAVVEGLSEAQILELHRDSDEYKLKHPNDPSQPPPPGQPPPPSSRDVLKGRGHMFFHGTDGEPHFRHLLSQLPHAVHRRRVFREMRDDGYDQWTGYAGYNHGDFPDINSNNRRAYRGIQYRRLDARNPDKLELAVNAFIDAKDAGLTRYGCLFADDDMKDSGLRVILAERLDIIDRVLGSPLKDLVDVWIAGLEGDESHMGLEDMTAVGKYLLWGRTASEPEHKRVRRVQQPILIHLKSGQRLSTSWWKANPWCDGILLQMKGSVDAKVEFVQEAKRKIQSVGPGRTIAWGEGEYEASDEEAVRIAGEIRRRAGIDLSTHG